MTIKPCQLIKIQDVGLAAGSLILVIGTPLWYRRNRTVQKRTHKVKTRRSAYQMLRQTPSLIQVMDSVPWCGVTTAAKKAILVDSIDDCT